MREAEGKAEDEMVGHIREGRLGWQGPAWLLTHSRRRWAKAENRLKSAASRATNGSANDNADLSDIPLADLESVLLDAKELREKAEKTGKTG